MKTFVINLERSFERRCSMAERLDKIGLPYDFFPAVDGKKLNHDEVKSKYNQKWARRHLGRYLFPGEIGCALSHISVYKKIVENQFHFALILEDDVQLSPSIGQVCDAIEKIFDFKKPSMCLLSACHSFNHSKSQKIDDIHQLAPVSSATYGAYAYIVTLESAIRLIDILYPVVQVADDWGWNSRQTGITVFACTPPLATTGLLEHYESTIQTAGVHRGENLQERFKTWQWWKQKIYRKFWMKLDQFGFGYKYWR